MGKGKETAFVVVLAICAYLFLSDCAYAVRTFQEAKASYRKSDAVLLDRHGKVVHELRLDPKGRRLEWTLLRDISPALKRAVLYFEDRMFYSHHGVDWKAVGSAVINNLFSKTQRGASTVTMQLAALLDKGLRPGLTKKTLRQKWVQIQSAQEIEKAWTKDQILEAYLNLVTFRGELQGIAAASRGLFGKEPGGLDEGESLLLAALIRSPNASSVDIAKRTCVLGSSMNSAVTCSRIKTLATNTLTGAYSVDQKTAYAPHAAYKLIQRGNSLEVRSTLDGDLQRFAAEALRQQLMVVKPHNVNDGAVLVVDNASGDVLAYVGGSGENHDTRYVDGVQAKRQAGSTLKPFLYALALEKKLLTPASMLNDSPLDIPTERGIYKPENYGNDFKGPVTMRTALASSLNIPAVRTLSLVETGPFVERLKQLGFSQVHDADYHGYSLALGSMDVSLWELVTAYRTLADQGKKIEIGIVPERKKVRKVQVVRKDAAFLISDILSDREARSSTFGLENPLSTRFWTAVKTGTSKDMRDNWCIGYSRKYTVGVWVGNFSGAPMWNVSGVTGAAPVWFDIMNYLHKGLSVTPPLPPAGLVTSMVSNGNEDLNLRSEWFLLGTEPVTIHQARALPVTRIVYPVKGTVIALDPDIPEELQHIFFEAESGGRHYWKLNNTIIGNTSVPFFWKPTGGRYTLSLVEQDGRLVDSVNFMVKDKNTGMD